MTPSADEIFQEMARKEQAIRDARDAAARESQKRYRPEALRYLREVRALASNLLEGLGMDSLTRISVTHTQQVGVFLKRSKRTEQRFVGWVVAHRTEPAQRLESRPTDFHLFLTHDGQFLDIERLSLPLGRGLLRRPEVHPVTGFCEICHEDHSTVLDMTTRTRILTDEEIVDLSYVAAGLMRFEDLCTKAGLQPPRRPLA